MVRRPLSISSTQWPATALALALLAGATAAQSVLRFDMGPRTSPVAAGFTPVTKNDVYPSGAGAPYGWESAPSFEFSRTAFQFVPSNLDADLYLDGATQIVPLTFRADVPNGDYRVVLHLGDPVDTADSGASALDRIRIRARVELEGTELASDVWARTLRLKAQVLQPHGGHRRIHLRTTVSDGTLDVRLVPKGGHTRVALAGVEIYPDHPEPLRFDTVAGELVADTAFGTTFSNFLTELNGANYSAARTEALSINDDLARAYAAAWLGGWLTGDEADLDEPLLFAADAALVTYANPDDVRAATLQAEIADVLLAKQYNDARGYSQHLVPISLPDPNDPTKVSIVSNLSAAAMLFEQVQTDLFGPLASGQPQSPLFFRAAYLVARNFHSRNTKQQGDLQAEFNTYWMGTMDELGTLDDLYGCFPDADALAVFVFMVRNYPQAGGIITNWDSTSTPTFDPATSWWGSQVTYTPDPNAPTWANLQREYHRAYRAAADWWMTNRLIDDEIGGGAGDDVEGGALLAVPGAILSEPQNIGDTGSHAVLEAVLFGPKVSQSEGYFIASCSDVEHAAEFTTNPLFLLLPANFGSPRHWEFAHLTMRNFANQGANSWSTVTAAGHRQFWTYEFNAVSLCGPSETDVPMNVRAIIPGFSLMDYSSHPTVIGLFEELSDSWNAHLLSQADQKPRGVYPATVDHGNPPSFAGGGGWWKAPDVGYSLAMDPLPKTRNQSYLYSLARAMYLNSDDMNRTRFLEPILEGSRFLEKYDSGQLLDPTEGGDAWAAELLQGVIGNAVAESRFLFDDATVQSDLGVTAGDLAAMDTVVIPNYAGGWQNFFVDDSQPKDKSFIETDFEHAARWIQYFWPLATTSVTYADRIHVFTGANDPSRQFSMQVLYQAFLGGGYDVVPSFPISWYNPDPATELDLAVLVLTAKEELLEVLLFNYGTTARNVGMRFWRGIKFGDYAITLGEDGPPFDDVIDTGTAQVLETAFPITAKGTEYEFSLPPGTLHKLEVAFVPGTEVPVTLLQDLAIAEDDIVVDTGAGTLSVTIHNLGAKRTTGGTFDVLEDGTPIMTAIPIPDLQAPLDFTPRFVTLSGPYTPAVGASELTVVLKPRAGVQEIFAGNDSATVDL